MVSGLSDIAEGGTLALAYTRGKTNEHRVEKIQPVASGKSTANLHAFLGDNGLTMSQLDDWCASKGKPPASEMDEAGQSRVAAYLASSASAVADVRAIGGE